MGCVAMNWKKGIISICKLNHKAWQNPDLNFHVRVRALTNTVAPTTFCKESALPLGVYIGFFEWLQETCPPTMDRLRSRARLQSLRAQRK